MVASLVIGGLLVLAMVAVSGRAAVTLAADARIPIHFGSPEHSYLVSKRAGLVIWPAAGAVLYGVIGGVTGSSLAAGWVPGVRDVLVPGAAWQEGPDEHRQQSGQGNAGSAAR